MNVRSRFHPLVVLGVVLAAALMTGCETAAPDPLNLPPDPPPADTQGDADDPQITGEPEPEPEPTIIGDWLVSEGSLFPPGVGIPIETPAMILRDDGTGIVVARDPKSGIENCLEVLYAILNDRLVLDYGASAIPLGRVFTFELSDANSLTAFDQDGRLAILDRLVDGLPPERCQSVTELSRKVGLPKPAGFGELEFDGTNLYYASDEFPDPYELRSINAQTGELNPSLNIFPPFATAIMNGGFWTHCACGGSQDATLRTPAMTVDTVVTTQLGHDVSAYYMAADEANGIVWIAGPSNGPNYKLLKVDVASEPDVLLKASELDTPVQSLTYDGTHLWALQGFIRSVIVRLDADSGEILEVWQVPDTSLFWSSIAFHDGRMFLLGADSSENGVIIEVDPLPQP